MAHEHERVEPVYAFDSIDWTALGRARAAMGRRRGPFPLVMGLLRRINA